MANRWPINGQSMANRWPIDGQSIAITWQYNSNADSMATQYSLSWSRNRFYDRTQSRLGYGRV
eukprot:7809713-Lingulodinium_polyedra.AAC.1